MITADDVKRIREQSATKPKNGKVTTDMIANIRQSMAQQNTQQPVQAAPQPIIQSVQPTISQPTYANHGAIAQQGHQNIAQKQANIATNVTKPMTTYMQNGGSININDTASLAQLARERGMSEDEINYLQGRQQSSTLPSMQTQYKPLPGSTTSVAIPNSGYDPVKNYDIGYGNKEAQKVLNNVKMNSDDRSASTYVDAKANLEKAQREGNLREIAKNQGIIRNYENIYKSNYNKEWDKLKDADIKSLEEHAQGAAEDLIKSYEKLNTSTGENLRRAYDEYQRDLARYNEVKSRYDEAITYDELINNNPIKDFGKGFLVGAPAAVAKGMTYGKLSEDALLDFFGSARNPANINANSLLDYNNENYQVEKYSGAIERTAGDTDVTGEYQNMSPASAFDRLKQLAENNPEYRGLQTLLREISTHSYKGTAQDLAKELDRISREMYQGWKNTHTQAGFDWEQAQQEHNERVYGDNPVLKGIVNSSITTSEMLPSVAAGFVGQPASMATLFASAAGGSADQAINEGATINQGTLYGALSGATEVGTELIGGENVNRALGIRGQSLLSKVFGDSLKNLHINSKAAKTALGLIFDVAGEMTEEGIAQAIEPLAKTLVYDPNAMPENVGEYFKDIFDAAIEAIPSTLLMTGLGAGMGQVSNLQEKIAKTNQVRENLIQSINSQNLPAETKAKLIDEVRKASEEVITATNNASNTQVSEGLLKQAQEIEKTAGKTVDKTTLGALQFMMNNREGLNVQLFAEEPKKVNGKLVYNNGFYDETTRTMNINAYSKNMIETIAVHELAHDLKAGNAEAYQELQDQVLKYAEKLPQYQDRLAELRKTYEDSNAKFVLNDEATNDILAEAIGDREFLYTLNQEQPQLFERIYNWFRNVLFDGNQTGLNLEQRRLLNKMKNNFREIYQGEYSPTPGQENNEVLHHYSSTLSNDIDKVISDISLSKLVKLRDYTPSVLTQFGAIQRALYANASHIRMNVLSEKEARKLGLVIRPGDTYHALGKQKYIEAINNMDDPRVVFRRKANPNEYLMLTFIKDNNGNNIIVPIEIDASSPGGKRTYNRVKTVYGYDRKNPNLNEYIKHNIDYNIFEKIYEKKKPGTNNISQQASNGIASSVPNNTIPQTPNNVNILGNLHYSLSKAEETDNQGRQLSPKQQEFFKDSAIRDVDGKLKPMYHGTNADFNIFDIGKLGNNTKNSGNFGDGFYFTYDKRRSQDYGKNTKEVYLNIKNPFPFQSLYSFPNGQESYSDFAVINNLVNLNNEWGKIPVKFGSKYTWQDIANEVNKSMSSGKTESQIDSEIYSIIGDIAEQTLPDRIYTYAKQEGYKTLREALIEKGFDGIYDGNNADSSSQFVAFYPNQIKNVDNTSPTSNPDIRYSQNNSNWQQFLEDNFNWAKGTKTRFEDLLPSNEELQKAETKSVENEPMLKMTTDTSLEDMRNFKDVGKKDVKAYQYENPEVKPFFQHEAENMLQDLNNAIKGERVWSQNGEGYGVESYYNVSGITREVTDDIADLLDGNNGVKLSYDDIRKGLNAIIEDHGAENIAAAKRIEMVLDKRLREGYTDSYGTEYPANENYQNFLEGKDYIDPTEYEKQQAENMTTDDGTLFSLSEEEQKEVNDYADKLFEDKTLDENFASDVYDRLKRVQNYTDFENIKQEVSDYKDKIYKGISSLADIANLKPEDARQQPMTYKQRKDKNTANQRKFFENVETSPIIAEETKNRINATTYERKSNLDTMEKVKQELDEKGNEMVEEWKHKSKNFTDKDVALGAILLERYQQNGDWNSAARTAEKLADMGTEAGRVVQMYSIWQRLSPETMQLFAQKQLNEAFEEMKQRKTGKWVEANKDKFKLTAEETQFIYDQVEKASQAIDDETKQRELSKIETMINNKLPPEKGQAIKALRRLAMLGNIKTQVRNLAGNAIIVPINDVVDVIGTAIDKAIATKTGKRTTALPQVGTKLKGFAKGLKDAYTDYKTNTRTTTAGSKYEFEIGAKPFNENTSSKVRNAINKKLNAANRLLGAIMSGGDRPFAEAAYQNSLKGQMKANKVTEATPDMIDIATNESLQRTWNDNNNYTKTVLTIRRAMNNININGFGLGDLIIPFAKTPANLTKAIVEYSPAGFIESVIDFNDMRKAISRGEMTPMQQKRFVASMSKAITGTILYAIAGSLVKAGAITGSADDDKDVKNFEQNVLGIQPYSVRLGDKTYTYSWANPINAPLAIMADTYKMTKENANKWDILKNAFTVAGDVLTENSFLQGIKELFSSEGVTKGFVNAVEDAPASFIPTLFSQIAQAFDNKKRQTFEYKNDKNTVLNSVKYKIPGARNTLEPQVNTFGEEIENDTNPFNVFLSPANVREAKTTEAQNELYSLYEATKDKTIFPVQAPYYVNDGGENKNLTPKQRNTYQKASGKYATSIYDDLFDSDYYDSISDSKKTEVLQKVAQDANKIGKTQVGVWTDESIKLDYRKQDLEDMSIPLADYYIAWSAQKDVEGDKNANGKTINLSSSKNKKEAIDKAVKGLEQEQMEMLYGIFDISEKVW